VTLGIENDLVGLSLGAAVEVTLDGVKLAGAYVTRKTNSNLVEVALPVAGAVKYAADGAFQVADGKKITAKSTGTIKLV
jgi:hypothetical protein